MEFAVELCHREKVLRNIQSNYTGNRLSAIVCRFLLVDFFAILMSLGALLLTKGSLIFALMLFAVGLSIPIALIYVAVQIRVHDRGIARLDGIMGRNFNSRAIYRSSGLEAFSPRQMKTARSIAVSQIRARQKLRKTSNHQQMAQSSVSRQIVQSYVCEHGVQHTVAHPLR